MSGAGLGGNATPLATLCRLNPIGLLGKFLLSADGEIFFLCLFVRLPLGLMAPAPRPSVGGAGFRGLRRSRMR